MDIMQYQEILKSAMFGYAYHEVVKDDKGKVCDYRFLEVNKTFVELTGAKQDIFTGKTIKEVYPQITQETVDWIDIYGKIATEGGSQIFEAKSKLFKKSFKIQAISLKPGYFTTIFFDISHYCELQEELSASEERLHLLLENSNEWVIILNADLKVVYSTRLGEQLLGLEVEKIFDLDVLSVVHPDDLIIAKNIITWLQNNPGELTTKHFRVLSTNNKSLWLEVSAMNLLSMPAISGIIAHVRDISESKAAENALRESENKLRYITDNITDVVFMTDKNFETTYVSPSVMQMFGEGPEEYMARSLEERHPPESLAIMQEAFAEEIARDKQPGVDLNRTRFIELQHYRKDGSLADISMHVSMIRDEHGEFAGLRGVSRDISQKKKTEQELKEKNKYIESLLLAIPDPIFVLNKEGMISDLKSGLDNMLYIPREQIQNQYLNEILPKELSDKMLLLIQQVLETGETRDIQYELEQDGKIRAYEARISPFADDKVISIVREITEQRRAAQSILARNKFQKMIVDISTAFVKSKNTNLSLVLDNSLKLVGDFFGVQRAYIYRYSEDYSVLRNSNEWCAPGIVSRKLNRDMYHTSAIPWWHKQILEGSIIKIPDLAKLEKEAPIEYQILKEQNIKSILCIPISSRARVLGYFGFDSIGSSRLFSDAETDNLLVVANLLGEVLQKNDIESQMRNQSRLREIISHIAMKYINLPSNNLEENILDSLAELAAFSRANRAFIFHYEWDKQLCIRISEWYSKEIANIVSVPKIIHIEDLKPWTQMHQNGEIVALDDVQAAELPEKLKSILLAQNVKSLVIIPLISDEHCLGFVGFDFVKKSQAISSTDINLLSLFAQLLVNVRNRRALEQSLIQEKERAETANRAKSEFLANMSHEIRTPLNGVLGFAELLYNSGLDEVHHQYAQNIINSSYNLLGIISDILDFSKIEAGKLDLSPVRTDLIELLEHATDIVKIKTGKKDLELLLDINPDLPRYAVVDPLRLNQILINLLSNAEKFTDQGEVELKVNYALTDSEHADIFFQVRDTGIGIEPALQKRLFRAFSQLDSSTTRKYGGTGLGLVISNHLASLMNSYISLESEPGKGSIFRFNINCRIEQSKREKVDIKKIKRVLVLDDNQTSLKIIAKYLSLYKLQVNSFLSPQKALDHLAEAQVYDLILVDYAMPELNGLDTINKMVLRYPEKVATTTIVLMHGASEEFIIQHSALAYDLKYRLIKPIKAHSLQELLLSIENQVAVNAPPKNKATANTNTPKYVFKEKPRILIAEDNYLNLTLLKEMILQSMPQAEIFPASDGLLAIEEVRKHDPHIVLMDVQMPNMDGVSASIEIRKFSNTPIIAITAGALKEEQDRCISAGMNDFLTKPVMANELLNSLLEHLGKSLPLQNHDSEISLSNKEDLNEPDDPLGYHFNRNALLKNISGDKDTLKSLLELAYKSFPKKLRNLKQAIDTQDYTEMKSLLHSLRGTAQNMHFDIFGKIARELETGYAELGSEQLLGYYHRLVEEWELVKKQIDTEV